MLNTIQKELKLAMSKMIEEVTYNGKTLVKLTTDNVAIVEAMIRNDSAYIRSTDVKALPIHNTKNEVKYGGLSYLIIQSQKYEQLKNEMCSYIEWRGENDTNICFEKSSFAFQKNHVVYSVEVSVIRTEKCITIKSQVPVRFESLYLYVGDVRRYEYLFDGAFYVMNK